MTDTTFQPQSRPLPANPGTITVTQPITVRDEGGGRKVTGVSIPFGDVFKTTFKFLVSVWIISIVLWIITGILFSLVGISILGGLTN